MHSQETLEGLPRYLGRIRPLRQALRNAEERHLERTGAEADYSRFFWTPPLPALNAFRLEEEQIRNQLGLGALVSLTDHDNIEPGTRLQLLDGSRDVPLSLEWTIPLGTSFLHLGIHNLPPDRAHRWVADMQECTRRPAAASIAGLLAALHDEAGVLVILNHPLWDEPGIGREAHSRMVREFLRRNGGFIHALEWNGFRPWHENAAVIELARNLNFPLISGGDRHGATPNAVLNLTGATTFAEFAEEVRADRAGLILVLPHYRGSYRLRWAECFLDIVREYPELAGRRYWTDRVFSRERNGEVQALSECWSGEVPGWISVARGLMRLIQSRPLRYAVRAVLAANQAAA
jgi:hypothetical protein